MKTKIIIAIALTLLGCIGEVETSSPPTGEGGEGGSPDESTCTLGEECTVDPITGGPRSCCDWSPAGAPRCTPLGMCPSD
jgi:hypothetical protein